MSASLAVQKAIRARLVADEGIRVFLTPSQILDRNARPNPVPSIIIGEDQEIDEGDIARRNMRVVSTLHVWVKETGLTGAKAITAAIRTAVREGYGHHDHTFHFGDVRVSSARFLRDPDGEHSHGIITIETLVHEVRA